MDYREEFDRILAKKPKDLTEAELRLLIKKVGYLDDVERKKFSGLLKVSNLTKAEYEKYQNLQLLEVYFSKE